MTVILRALNCELKKVDKRLSKVTEFMEANPLGRIIELRAEAQDILKKYDGDYAKINKLIEPLAAEEKKMFTLSKKQIADTTAVDERVRLESEKRVLINAIYSEERRVSNQQRAL